MQTWCSEIYQNLRTNMRRIQHDNQSRWFKTYQSARSKMFMLLYVFIVMFPTTKGKVFYLTCAHAHTFRVGITQTCMHTQLCHLLLFFVLTAWEIKDLELTRFTLFLLFYVYLLVFKTYRML